MKNPGIAGWVMAQRERTLETPKNKHLEDRAELMEEQNLWNRGRHGKLIYDDPTRDETEAFLAANTQLSEEEK